MLFPCPQPSQNLGCTGVSAQQTQTRTGLSLRQEAGRKTRSQMERAPRKQRRQQTHLSAHVSAPVKQKGQLNPNLDRSRMDLIRHVWVEISNTWGRKGKDVKERAAGGWESVRTVWEWFPDSAAAGDAGWPPRLPLVGLQRSLLDKTEPSPYTKCRLPSPALPFMDAGRLHVCVKL